MKTKQSHFDYYDSSMNITDLKYLEKFVNEDMFETHLEPVE